jgi:hypothetical protein
MVHPLILGDTMTTFGRAVGLFLLDLMREVGLSLVGLMIVGLAFGGVGFGVLGALLGGEGWVWATLACVFGFFTLAVIMD